MNKLEYFNAKIESTLSPMDYIQLKKIKGDDIVLVDVRNAPKHIKKDKIKDSLEIQQIDILDNLDQLPKDKLIVVYCWESWCNLAAKSCVTLLENGYDCMELGGGIASWKVMNMPIEDL
jgi:rhodanese-related sulfurtransferase